MLIRRMEGGGDKYTFRGHILFENVIMNRAAQLLHLHTLAFSHGNVHRQSTAAGALMVMLVETLSRESG